MPIVLARVDDRLIHGQVVIGWGQHLRATRIVLVDDAVAADPDEQALYRMAAPPGLAVEFATSADAGARAAAWASEAPRTILLTGDIATMAAVRRAAPAAVPRINVGGVHHRPGRRERLRYVFLSDDEAATLAALAAEGAEVTAQDVPSASPLPLATFG